LAQIFSGIPEKILNVIFKMAKQQVPHSISWKMPPEYIQTRRGVDLILDNSKYYFLFKATLPAKAA
jgi:hypothetical protein